MDYMPLDVIKKYDLKKNPRKKNSQVKLRTSAMLIRMTLPFVKINEWRHIVLITDSEYLYDEIVYDMLDMTHCVLSLFSII